MIKDTLDYIEPITEIYLIRHGETKANKLRLIFGHLDWDLTKKGELQASKAGNTLSKLLKEENIDFIISSPLKRAKHTAQIIAKKININKITTEKDLMEKGEGVWEGKNYWEVREYDYKNYLKWLKDPVKYRPLKGESLVDVNKRIKRLYTLILKKYAGKKLVLVSHSGPIRLFLLSLLAVKSNKFWSLSIDCGSISKISISKTHSTIFYINK